MMKLLLILFLLSRIPVSPVGAFNGPYQGKLWAYVYPTEDYLWQYTGYVQYHILTSANPDNVYEQTLPFEGYDSQAQVLWFTGIFEPGCGAYQFISGTFYNPSTGLEFPMLNFPQTYIIDCASQFYIPAMIR